MRIISLLLLFVFGLTSAVFAANKNDDFYLKYYVDIGQSQKGMLVVQKQGNEYTSRYYNIDKSDKLPFYAPQKEGTIVDGYISTSLKFSGNSFGFYYDSETVTPIFKQFAMGTGKGRALVMDEVAKRPKMSIDNLPAVSFEGILLGAISKTLPLDKEMIFFDTSKNSGMKIYFKKSGGVDRSSGCNVTTIQCVRKNIEGQADVALFSIQLIDGHIPKIIESGSGRWRIKLDAYTSDYTVRTEDLSAREIAHGKTYINRMLQKNVKPSVKVVSRHDGAIKYNYSLSEDLNASFTDDELLAGYIKKEFRGQLPAGMFKGEFFKKDHAGFVASMDKAQACDALRDKKDQYPKGDYSNDCSSFTYLKKETIKAALIGPGAFPDLKGKKCQYYKVDDGVMSNSLVCVIAKDEEETVSLKDAVKQYLKKNRPEVLAGLDDIEPVKKGARISYEMTESVPGDALYQIALATFAKKLHVNSKRIKPNMKQFGDDFLLRINTKEIDSYRLSLAQQECSKLAAKISETKGQYSSGVCRLSGTFKQNFSEFYNQLENKIYDAHPDIRYAGETIDKSKKGKWTYRLLDGVEGVDDDCIK